jgi:aspartyl-tRNA(Asn)/glutamyl-tRNA(Gln) amidotransferase subunit B
MRSKEEAHDYRYFPDPDLPVVQLEQSWVDELRAGLPELPDEKLARFQSQFGLSAYDSQVLVADRATAEFFEQVLESGVDAKRAANWVTVELAARFNADKSTVADLKFPAGHLAEMIRMIEAGELSSKMAKTVFEVLYETGAAPADIVKEKGLSQVSDVGELEGIVDNIIAESAEQVEQYRSGKHKVIGYFVGQVMKATKGQANPAVVNDLLKAKLSQ